jgi:prepilin-type N-terminal cleavage/methylation domain-containing protein
MKSCGRLIYFFSTKIALNMVYPAHINGRENSVMQCFCIRRVSSRKGFTLIELLIVVAIIAILAAIAVPNFLEAQTRAKVSRAKNDMRTLALACESYNVDTAKYPCNISYGGTWGIPQLWSEYLNTLTTPIAYLASVNFRDAFIPSNRTTANINWRWMFDNSIGSYTYRYYGDKFGLIGWNYMMAANNGGKPAIDYREAFVFTSYGPDREYTWSEYGAANINLPAPRKWEAFGTPFAWYDPTNGTVSKGDIIRFGGDAPMTTNG